MSKIENLIVPPFRHATLDDVFVLTQLVNFAGEGLPLYLWSRLSGGEADAWAIGRQRAAREEGSFSYRNAIIIESVGQPAGTLIGYEIPETIEPVPGDMPAMFQPLQQLENLAPGTWYVNVLAVQPEFRSRSFGTRLLGLADEIGRALGKRGMSVIVSDANLGARGLYERCGYRQQSQRKMVKEDWKNDGENWVLLTKVF